MVLAIVLLAGALVSGQDLSTDVYPSEDELLEALRRGEIDQERYLILLEILREGIDSSTVHLFDEVPSLAGRQTAQSRLASEQAEAFRGSGAPGRRFGQVDYRYTREAGDAGRGSYRTRIRLFPIEHIKLSLALDRSVSGRERWVGRSLRYAGKNGLVREVALGTFSRRLGLGTVVGYRGRMFDCANRYTAESALFPDYGGQNGGYIRLEQGKWRTEGLGSIQRDSAFGLVAAAGMVERKLGRVRVAGIMGVNRLNNRSTGKSLTDVKLGGTTGITYGAGEASMEVTGQVGARAGIGAVVLEGEHRVEGSHVKFAAWWYGEDYLDLSGGSKAGALSAMDSVEVVGYRLRTRRSGSRGGMLRTAVPIGAGMQLETVGIFSAFGRDTARGDMLAAVTREFGRHGQIRGDLLARITRRADGSPEDEDVTRRARLEGRWDERRLATRAYIGHAMTSDGDDYWMIFARVRYGSARLGNVELWMNLGRIAMNRGQVDYGYGYVRCSQSLRSGVEGALKIAHRYSRSSGERYDTTVALEVRVEL